MGRKEFERRLAAILVADVVGYSRLVEADETGALSVVQVLQDSLIQPLLHEHDGRVVKFMGDGIIAEFGSAVRAVAFAVALQGHVARLQGKLRRERRIAFRIGINLGDVVVDGDDVLGHGVNVAARLEQLCEPGGILISGTAYDQVQGKLGLSLDYVGEQHVKNISQGVRTYRVRLNNSTRPLRLHFRRLPKWVAPTASVLLLLMGSAVVWTRTREPPQVASTIKWCVTVSDTEVNSALTDVTDTEQLQTFLTGLKSGSYVFSISLSGDDAARQLSFGRRFAFTYDELVEQSRRLLSAHSVLHIDDVTRELDTIVTEEKAVDFLLRRKEQHFAISMYLRALQHGLCTFPKPGLGTAVSPSSSTLFSELTQLLGKLPVGSGQSVFSSIYPKMLNFSVTKPKVSDWEISRELRRLILESSNTLERRSA